MVLVNFSISLQRQSYMGNSCNHDQDTICCTRRRGRHFRASNSVITVISSYLEFKGYSAVRDLLGKFTAMITLHFDLIPQYKIIWIISIIYISQKLICRTQISNGIDRLDPNTTHIKIMFIWIAYFYWVILHGVEPMWRLGWLGIQM